MREPALSEKAQAALKARERLYRRYTATKAAAFAELCSNDPHGAELRQFARQLETFSRLDDAAALLTAVQAATQWLRNANFACFAMALSLASERITAIRMSRGLPPFDDPLPGEDDDVFQICRRVLQ